MAISSVTNRVAYQTDGTSAIYAFPYEIFQQSDVAVFVYNSTGTQANFITPQALNTNYTVSGSPNTTGIYPAGVNVIFNSAPNAQSVVVLFRSSIVTNTFFVPQNGAIPSTSLNNELDYLTIISQRLQDQVTRSVRMHDGFPGTFDPTLPATIPTSAGQSLLVNSTATGWTLAFPNTGAFIPNTVIYADTNKIQQSIPGAAAGYVLQSNGSSAPTWGQVTLGSASISAGSIVGTLQTSNGGTGNSANYTPQGIVYASSATQLASTGAGGTDVPLLATTGGIPSFRALPLSSGSSVTGTLPILNGGTGNTNFTPNQIIYANSPTLLSGINPGAAGFALVSNGSTAPTFQAVVAINSGILATTGGGTGTGGPFTATGLIFASSATSFATVPSATPGYLLTANGSSAPTFNPPNLSVNSGIVAVGFGGTGTGTSFTQYGVVYASSATQLSTIPVSTVGFILTSTGSSAPTFQAPISNGSVNSGVVAVGFGGTGTATSYIQYGLIYASSATQFGTVQSATSGFLLTAQGSSAPAFMAMAAANLTTGSGVVATVNGGTGNSTTLTQWGVVYASSTTQMSVVPPSTVGFVLTSNGSSAPTFQAAPGTTPARMAYTDTAGGTIQNAYTNYTFATKLNDVSNMYSGGVITIPANGDYIFSFLTTISTTMSTGVTLRGQIFSITNSSAKLYAGITGLGVAADYTITATGAISCSTGHQFAAQLKIGSGAPTMSNVVGYNNLSVTQIA